MELRVQRIDEHAFDLLREEWNALLAESASNNFFLRWEWIHSWWRNYRKGRSLCVLTAREGSRLVAVAPFYIERSKGFLGVKTLRICSDELSPDYMDVFSERGEEARCLKAFLQYLRRHDPCDVLVFESVLQDSALMSHLQLFDRCDVYAYKLSSCPYVKIEGDYQAYIQSRRKDAKISEKEFRWKRELLEKDHGVTHVVVNSERMLEKAVSDLLHLHGKRTGEKGIKSNFLTAHAPKFHLELCRLLLDQGLLNFQFFYQGDRPLAADYLFNYKNKYYGYQKGMDPHWGKLSVGTLLQREIIQQAFNAGIAEMDFGKGEESYKYSWSNASRDVFNIVIFENTMKARLLNTLRKSRQWTRAQVRRFGPPS